MLYFARSHLKLLAIASTLIIALCVVGGAGLFYVSQHRPQSPAVALASPTDRVCLALAPASGAPPLASAPLSAFQVVSEADNLPDAQPDSVLVSALISWHPTTATNISDLRVLVDRANGTFWRIEPLPYSSHNPNLLLPLNCDTQVGWLTFEVPADSHSGILSAMLPDGGTVKVPVQW